MVTKPALSFCADESPPYSYRTADGVDGWTVALLREIGNLSGDEIRISVENWKRCVATVKSGLYDGALDALPRDGFLTSAQPSNRIGYSLVTRRDAPENSRADMLARPTLRMGVLNVYMDVFDYRHGFPAATHIDVVRVPSTVDLLQLLEYGRVDAAHLAPEMLDLYAGAHDKLKILPPAAATLDMYLLYGPGKETMKARLDAAMATLEASGRRAQIYRAVKLPTLPWPER